MNEPLNVDWSRFFLGGEKIMVGISGGADSLYLALILAGKLRHRLLEQQLPPLRLTLYNAKFEGRGEEAQDDVDFLRGIAEQLGAEFLWDSIPEDWQGSTTNLEADLREWRYERMIELARERGCSLIALGHNLNDVAETFLLMALRGSGPRGLGSLRPLRRLEGEPGVTLIRPLLQLTREEIRSELLAAGYTWREDSYNLDAPGSPNLVRRNILRHRVLPQLQELEPAVVRLLAKSAELCTVEHEAVNSWADEVLRRAVLCVEPTKRLLIPLSLLQENARKLPLILRRIPCLGTLSLNDLGAIQEAILNPVEGEWWMELAAQPPLRRSPAVVGVFRKRFFATNEQPTELALCRELERDWQALFEPPKKWKSDWVGIDSRLKIDKPKKMPKGLGKCDVAFPKHIFKEAHFRPLQNTDKIAIKSGRTKSTKSALQEAGIPVKARPFVLGLFFEDELLWIPGIRRSELYPVSEKMAEAGEVIRIRWRPLLPTETP